MEKRLTTAIIILLIANAVLLLVLMIMFASTLLNTLDNNFTSVDYGGVTYMPVYGGPNDFYRVKGLSESVEGVDGIYVYDEINGAPVNEMYFVDNADTTSSREMFVNRIYFPWSIDKCYVENADNIGLIISASANIYNYENINHDMVVIPKATYDKISEKPGASRCIAANVAYFFNYSDAQNEGYFFVDLIDEPGKLTRPPYNPSRAGYTFSGWYTEPECINEWNFDNVLDEIPGEFGLYAKWVEN